MDSSRFDSVVRYLAAQRISRRSALVASGAGLTAAAIGVTGRSAAQDATPAAGPEAQAVELLFVQIFSGGKLEPVAGETDGATLTLSSGVGQSVYFADRPNRQVGTIATDRLLAVLSAQTTDPVNAALVAETPDGGSEFVILELLQGDITGTGEVTYKARLLRELDDFDMQLEQEPVTELSGPREYGAVHLFIDDLGCSPWDPRC